MDQNFTEFEALQAECQRLQRQVAEINSEMTSIMISITKIRKAMFKHISGPKVEDVDLKQLFQGGPMKHHQLCMALKAATNWGDNKVKEMIRYYIQSGKIIRDGRERSPKARYRLP